MSKESKHYVKNADFLEALIKYREACEKAKEMLDDNEPFPSHEEHREEVDE